MTFMERYLKSVAAHDRLLWANGRAPEQHISEPPPSLDFSDEDEPTQPLSRAELDVLLEQT